MSHTQPQEVTQLLLAWSHGDRAALDRLIPLVLNELRRLAHHYMRGEHAGHTLQTTALVDEALRSGLPIVEGPTPAGRVHHQRTDGARGLQTGAMPTGAP